MNVLITEIQNQLGTEQEYSPGDQSESRSRQAHHGCFCLVRNQSQRVGAAADIGDCLKIEQKAWQIVTLRGLLNLISRLSANNLVTEF